MKQFMDEMNCLTVTEELPEELLDPIEILRLLGFEVTFLRDGPLWILGAEHVETNETYVARASSIAELIEAISASIGVNLSFGR